MDLVGHDEEIESEDRSMVMNFEMDFGRVWSGGSKICQQIIGNRPLKCGGVHSGVPIFGQIPIFKNNFGSTPCAGVEIHPIQWHLDEAITKSISNIFGCYKQEIYFIGTL